jgi:hypothetical protein
VQRLFNSKYPEAEPTALAVSDAAAPALTVAVGLGSGMVYVFQVGGGGRGFFPGCWGAWCGWLSQP